MAGQKIKQGTTSIRTDRPQISNKAGQADGANATRQVMISARDPFTTEKMVACWSQFKPPKTSKNYDALLRLVPKKNTDTEMLLELSNEIQLRFFDEFRAELVQHLRHELNNGGVTIKVTVAGKEENKTNSFLTDKERYDEMVKKNPFLDHLRKTFDLDFE